mmetsp:Transcript_35004/g.54705  ORF Transcript_35004/g.54705 Transcript_35004/m.54705 type:complete len:127 (+) Transcript_35004:259-639(+)
MFALAAFGTAALLALVALVGSDDSHPGVLAESYDGGAKDLGKSTAKDFFGDSRTGSATNRGFFEPAPYADYGIQDPMPKRQYWEAHTFARVNTVDGALKAGVNKGDRDFLKDLQTQANDVSSQKFP